MGGWRRPTAACIVLYMDIYLLSSLDGYTNVTCIQREASESHSDCGVALVFPALRDSDKWPVFGVCVCVGGAATLGLTTAKARRLVRSLLQRVAPFVIQLAVQCNPNYGFFRPGPGPRGAGR